MKRTELHSRAQTHINVHARTHALTHTHMHACTHTHSFPSHRPLCPHIHYTHLPASPSRTTLLASLQYLCKHSSVWPPIGVGNQAVHITTCFLPPAVWTTSHYLETAVNAMSQFTYLQADTTSHNSVTTSQVTIPEEGLWVLKHSVHLTPTTSIARKVPPPPPFSSAKGTQLCMLHGVTTHQLNGNVVEQSRSKE